MPFTLADYLRTQGIEPDQPLIPPDMMPMQRALRTPANPPGAFMTNPRAGFVPAATPPALGSMPWRTAVERIGERTAAGQLAPLYGLTTLLDDAGMTVPGHATLARVYDRLAPPTSADYAPDWWQRGSMSAGQSLGTMLPLFGARQGMSRLGQFMLGAPLWAASSYPEQRRDLPPSLAAPAAAAQGVLEMVVPSPVPFLGHYGVGGFGRRFMQESAENVAQGWSDQAFRGEMPTMAGARESLIEGALPTALLGGLGLQGRPQGPAQGRLPMGTPLPGGPLPGRQANKVADKVWNLTATTGGATVRPIDGASRAGKSGFAVSIYPGREVLVPAGEFTPEVVRSFVQQNSDVLKSDPAAHVGAWLNNATGRVHLDISGVIPNEADARAIGDATNQIALFDLARNAEIPLREPRSEDADLSDPDNWVPVGQKNPSGQLFGELPIPQTPAPVPLAAGQQVAAPAWQDRLWNAIEGAWAPAHIRQAGAIMPAKHGANVGAARGAYAFAKGVQYAAHNDKVEVTSHGGRQFKLYGNTIAHFTPPENGLPSLLRLTDAGWQTRTTMKRLNAILEAAELPERIVVRDGKWMIGYDGRFAEWRGEYEVQAPKGIVAPRFRQPVGSPSLPSITEQERADNHPGGINSTIVAQPAPDAPHSQQPLPPPLKTAEKEALLHRIDGLDRSWGDLVRNKLGELGHQQWLNRYNPAYMQFMAVLKQEIGSASDKEVKANFTALVDAAGDRMAVEQFNHAQPNWLGLPVSSQTQPSQTQPSQTQPSQTRLGLPASLTPDPNAARSSQDIAVDELPERVDISAPESPLSTNDYFKLTISESKKSGSPASSPMRYALAAAKTSVLRRMGKPQFAVIFDTGDTFTDVGQIKEIGELYKSVLPKNWGGLAYGDKSALAVGDYDSFHAAAFFNNRAEADAFAQKVRNQEVIDLKTGLPDKADWAKPVDITRPLFNDRNIIERLEKEKAEARNIHPLIDAMLAKLHSKKGQEWARDTASLDLSGAYIYRVQRAGGGSNHPILIFTDRGDFFQKSISEWKGDREVRAKHEEFINRLRAFLEMPYIPTVVVQDAVPYDTNQDYGDGYEVNETYIPQPASNPTIRQPLTNFTTVSDNAGWNDGSPDSAADVYTLIAMLDIHDAHEGNIAVNEDGNWMGIDLEFSIDPSLPFFRGVRNMSNGLNVAMRREDAGSELANWRNLVRIAYHKDEIIKQAEIAGIKRDEVEIISGRIDALRRIVRNLDLKNNPIRSFDTVLDEMENEGM